MHFYIEYNAILPQNCVKLVQNNWKINRLTLAYYNFTNHPIVILNMVISEWENTRISFGLPNYKEAEKYHRIIKARFPSSY